MLETLRGKQKYQVTNVGVEEIKRIEKKENGELCMVQRNVNIAMICLRSS